MKWLRRLWPYALLVVLVAGNVTVWVQRDNIADWWRLRDYTAPSSISELATDTTMTDRGRHLFYINHPSLEDKKAFNEHCSDYNDETSVLGCYHGDRQGIYLYAVTEPRLEGVRQVTAAHEMLHQAYDRLSGGERDRINALLRSFYDNGLNDMDIRDKIDSYKEHGADLTNEMHSIFGSEVRTLPVELETYYKQYFANRLKVVGYVEAYRAEFTRRKDLVAQYDAELAALKKQINSNKSSMNSKLTYLKEKEKEIDQDIASANQAEYESDVRDYNDMVASHNAQALETQQSIERHNQIVQERNELAVQEHELQEALDSRLEPEQKQQ